jgi:AAA+ ATPase superfamily predicted ATPase
VKLVGRKQEIGTFQHCMVSSESKLIAVYGRRRIGKTFLIRKFFDGKFVFEITGLHGGEMTDQLTHFNQTLALSGFSPSAISAPSSWMEAFRLLMLYLDKKRGKGKKILFFDELPWMDTPRSNFLMAFENFWNAYCTKRSDIIVVICGSAASWMIKKVINNRGGLHNRVSEKINLQPFTLQETKAFLVEKGIKWSNYDIAQLYMTTGGVPFYLDAVKKGESVAQWIDRSCFNKNGLLYFEYDQLYKSLFEESHHHQNIIKALANAKQGLQRDQIIEKTSLSSGGTLTKALEELEQSGFIKTVIPYGVKLNGKMYQLVDFFTIFYHKFMVKKGVRQTDSWLKIVNGPSYTSWSGLAYERLCVNHISQIKASLGLQAIETVVSSWASDKDTSGVQIDLLISRADRIIHVCEIKFSKSIFTIDKSTAANLRNKLAVFGKTAPKQNLFLTMITTYGTFDNEYYKELVQNSLTLDDLFIQ